MKTVLIFRGLPKGRRESLINTVSKNTSGKEYTRIDTPQPKAYLTKEQMKDLATHSFNKFKEEVNLNRELIIVNNANLRHHHYFSYMTYAQKHGYVVGIVLAPWNDLTNRDLSIDSGGEVSSDKFREYRKSFEWGDFSKVIEYKKRQREINTIKS